MRSYKVYCYLPEEELQPIELFMCHAVWISDFEKLLDAHAQLRAFGISPYASVDFAVEYTPDDEEYFGDSGAGVNIYPPESREEMHQELTLDEYYAYLEDYANCYLANKSQEEKQRIYAKLAKVKEAFRHAK